MSSSKPAKNDANERRAQSVIDLATRALNLLQERADIPRSLPSELRAIVQHLPLPRSLAVNNQTEFVDELGTNLWNATTNVLHEYDSQPCTPDAAHYKAHNKLLSLLRTVAFFLLEACHCAARRRSRDEDLHLRIFKIAIKTSKFCIDKGELDLAGKALEKCAEYASKVEEREPLLRLSAATDSERQERQGTETRLVSEYLLLRVANAWKARRVDMAAHFASKLRSSDLAADAALGEKATDLFSGVAKWSVKQGDVHTALNWFERAIGVLDAFDPEISSLEAVEMRLTITHAFVSALLATHTEQSTQRALEMVNQLANDHGCGGRLVVLLMRFNILSLTTPLDEDGLQQILSTIIASTVLTQTTFKSIMQTISKAKKLHVAIACEALRELVVARLLPDFQTEQDSPDLRDWLEKCVVTCSLFATSSSSPQPSDLTILQQLLDCAYQHGVNSLSARATHAAQILLWKAASSADADSADLLYGLLRHPLFCCAGEVNQARIARKAMTRALDRDDLPIARQAFFQIPDRARSESLSRYLAFKLALRQQDFDFARESLAIIASNSRNDTTYLYACALEAQKSSYRHIAIAALQTLVDLAPPGVHLPALLRCTARLLLGELEHGQEDDGSGATALVDMFETAAANMQAFQQAKDANFRNESQWWCKNAYNLVLKLCHTAHPVVIIRLVEAGSRLLDFYPLDSGPKQADGVTEKRMVYHFLATSACIVLGRAEGEGVDHTLPHYTQARKHIEAFFTQKQQLADNAAALDPSINARAFELLKFDLESILRLKQWDCLDAAFDFCLAYDQVDRWDTLADLAIVVHDTAAREQAVSADQTRGVPAVLQKAIDEAWKRDRDVVKVARWVRIAFSINVDGSADEAEMSLDLLGQAASAARKGQESAGSGGRHGASAGTDGMDKYPEAELQWLAATAFNKSIDCLESGSGDGKAWVEGALRLAHWADDNGSLHANLTERARLVSERTKAIAARNGLAA